MKQKKFKYTHRRSGDVIEVKVTDFTRRTIYKSKFNVKDKNSILNLLSVLEKFSGFSINQLIREKLNIGEWF